MPAAPPAVYTPPSAGSPPDAPGAVFEPAPAGKAVMMISGVATEGINGPVIYCGLIANKPAWSTDGTQTFGASNTIVYYTPEGTLWTVVRSGSYVASKVSAAATPDGLTSWTVGTGTGSPVLTAFAVPTPHSIYTPPSAGSPPAAPGAVYTPPSAGSPPAAPPPVYDPEGTPIDGGGADAQFVSTLNGGNA